MDRLCIALIALGLAIGMGASAATASAAVPGWQLVSTTGATHSFNNTFESTTCPSPRQALGAGGSISTGAGQVGLISMITGATGTSLVSVEDPDGFSGSWSLTAATVCANPLPGLERLSAPSGASSTATRTASVSCPAGKRVVGTGFTHDSSLLVSEFGVFVLDDLRINESLTSVTVTSREAQGGTAAPWGLRAYADCAFPPPGLEFVKANSALDSTSPKSASAVCTAGKRVLAVGGEITGGLGEVRFETLRPYAFFSQGGLVYAREDQDGRTAAWDLRAYAVCATA